MLLSAWAVSRDGELTENPLMITYNNEIFSLMMFF